ncbi:hypothetical protein LAZ67_2003965, partial [Cordylochernes scorpioides]
MFPHVTQRSVTSAARIQPPETFDFSTPNEWPKWRKRFERYLVVSGMKKKEEADKIDLFMYLMGDRADDIFRTFKFEKKEEATKIDSVLKAFDSHFCVRKNIIYERAKFNSRIQEDREPVDEFITSLYKLADSCEFEGLHEQLIRDRMVVGVRDKALSERMQLDSELTLEKAVKMVRQQEAVRQQQVDLQRPSTSQKVNQVKFNSKKQSPKQQQQPSRKKEKSAKTRSRCPKCGGFTHREGQACRAEGQRCNLCSKTGHFANCCPDKQAKTAEVKAVSELDEEIDFLLEVSAVEDSSNLDDDERECRRRWTAEIQVNGKKVKFKLDSQADVTCVPLCLFKKIMGQQRLVKSDINLRAAEFSELQTVGMFISTLRNGNYEIKEKIYVIRRLSEPLLSRRACELLNLARRIEVVATRINPIKEFPEVFEGLGQIGNPYEIKLKPGAKPYAVHTPRRVPIPLMEKLKTRLEELEKAGIIAQVNVATEWCAPTVIAGKPNGDIRLCVDLSRLNEHVQREVHPMPVVEHMLGQLGEARFFSKLDANSGFHQIPLSPDCQHLTTFITPFGRYKYCRMPFGISLAPEYFQRVMSIILQGMDGVMCYLDDILIFASDSKTHDRILRLVLRKLKGAKVTLNKAKCVFGVPRINFLGHILDEDGIRPDPAKIEAVARMPAPTDVHGVRRFLGMVNHLGRKLRTTLPIAPENLNPKLVDSQTLKRKEGRRRKDMKSRYDRRCGATDMEELSEGDTVWITDMRTWGIVKKKASTPRSYMVDTPVGTLRRNRFHLRKGDTVQYPADPSTPTFSGEELVENEKNQFLKKGDVLRRCKKTSTYVSPRDAAERDLGCTVFIMSQNYNCVAPEPFNFSNPGDWPKWIRRFERFRQASGLINNPENEQVNMLVYCMGDNADDILLSCKIASDQLENYDKVIECFESHFIPRRNIIYERARFNQRCQQEGEKVNEFITALHSLAEHCNFGMLHDELIRDRIVVGVRDRALSERMQLDTDLTLVKATLMAKQLESIKEQQSSLYQQDSVDQIKKMPNHIKETKRHEPKIRQFKSNQLGGSSHGCTRCGNSNNHDWKNCPAMNSYCSKCKKKGHYAKVCRSEAINEIKSEIAFLGSVEDNSKKWIVPIKVNNRQINFKIDTGADVNVLPLQKYYQSFQRIKLEKSDKILQGPNGIPLETVGMIHVKLQNKGQHLNSKIYIVDKLKQPLLSGETSEKLNIVRMIQQLSSGGHGGQRGRLGSGDNRGCYNCGEEGHRKFECTKPARGGGRGRGQSRDGGSNNTCYNCGEVGHRKYECTNNTAEDGGQEENQRKSKKACYTCGEFGHKKDDCPKSGTQESGDEEESSDNEEEETPQERKQAEDSEEEEVEAEEPPKKKSKKPKSKKKEEDCYLTLQAYRTMPLESTRSKRPRRIALHQRPHLQELEGCRGTTKTRIQRRASLQCQPCIQDMEGQSRYLE